MKGKRILITGGCGFIGSHLAERLGGDNEVVILDDLSTGKLGNIKGLSPEVELVKSDICDPKLARKALEDCEYLFHLAALASVFKSIEEPVRTNRVNVDGTVSLLDLARKAGLERFVFVSSAAVYGMDPKLPKREDMQVEATSPYGASKIMGETYCRVFSKLYGVPCETVRLFNVYGPRQSLESGYATVIPKFISLMKKDKSPQIYGDGKQTRDFIHVDDVVVGLLLAAERGSGMGEVYNLASGKETSVNGLVEMLNAVLGKDIRAVHVEPVEGDIRFSYADISKAERELGFSPQTSLRDGLKKTLGFYS